MRIAIFIAAAFLVPQVALAEDPERLARGCEELVRIYDRHGEPGKLASFTTSLSDALRAGYCRGVIDEFIRAQPLGCRHGWRPMAVRIAKDGAGTPRASVEQLLEHSCGR